MDNIYSKKVLSFDEGVAYLGYSKRTVYKLTSAKVLPFFKPNGKKIFFDREKLEAWMLSNLNKPKEKLQETALDQKVRELKQQGRSFREIGAELGISYSKVKRIFDKL